MVWLPPSNKFRLNPFRSRGRYQSGAGARGSAGAQQAAPRPHPHSASGEGVGSSVTALGSMAQGALPTAPLRAWKVGSGLVHPL